MLQDNAIAYLAKDKWLRTLSECRGFQLPSSHSRARRKHPRFRMPGWATVTIKSDGMPEDRMLSFRCQILDASAEGLAVRSPKMIQRGRPVSIEICACGQHFWLSGKVAHTDVSAGFVRVAVLLEFDGIDGDHEGAGTGT